ncbi:MAG: peptidoglycan-binding protein [Methanobrevibacter sp.]|nr:peptidoglycan-binding protein [Methanobrevibacter sp.]MBR1748857.1 peptidoglycan-binding protein [Bacilli bacterium]
MVDDITPPVTIKTKDDPVFFSVIDTRLRTYTIDGETFENKPLVLNVLTNGGVDYSPNVKIKTTELSNGESVFKGMLRTDDSFKIKIMINRVYNYDTKEFEDVSWSGGSNVTTKTSGTVAEMLDYWIRNGIPVYVVTEAMDVPDGEYLIVDNSSRNQEYLNSTVWELEFKKYDGTNTIKFNFQNNVSDNAIKKYEKAKAAKAKAAKAKAAKKSQVKTKASDESQLRKCKRSSLVYSKKKKSVACVKTMQKILKKQGFYKSTIDGWFNKLTKNAIMAYQKKYKKKYSLKVTGKVDQYTYENLCGQIGRTKTVKSTLPKANKNGVIDLTKKK